MKTFDVNEETIYRGHHEVNYSMSLSSIGARDSSIPRKLLNNVAGVIYSYVGYLTDVLEKGRTALLAYPDPTSPEYERIACPSSSPLTPEVRENMKPRINALLHPVIRKLEASTRTSRSNGKICASTYGSSPFTPITPELAHWLDNPVWNLHHGLNSEVGTIWTECIDNICPQHLVPLVKTHYTHDHYQSHASPVIKFVLSKTLESKPLLPTSKPSPLLELEQETGLDLFARGPVTVPRRAKLTVQTDSSFNSTITISDRDIITDGVPTLMSRMPNQDFD